MNRLLMHYETALEYVDMDEGLFEAFISPQVAALMFGGEPYYLTEQLDSAVYTMIENSPTRPNLHLVE